jgi:nifR3 family TIM-barrel protein
VKNGEGAALMRNPAQAREIVRGVIRTVSVPVTVKMRSGWDAGTVNFLELARMLEDEGIKAITLHPRTREQFFSGQADWAAIKQLKVAVSIPVLGNGDVFAPHDALRMVEETGCDAVMIGRGGLGNPFLFAGARSVLAGGQPPAPPDIRTRIQTAMYHFDLMAGFKGQNQAITEMRKHMAWYTKGLPGAARTRALINQAATREHLFNLLEDLSE